MQLSDNLWRFVRFSATIVLGALIISLAFKPTPSQAANFSYSIDVNYDVEQTGVTNVKETYNITNNTPNQYLDSIKLSTPASEVNNLRVYYGGGGSIPFTTEKIATDEGGYKYEYVQINIDFPRSNVGRGTNWSFIIDYQTPDLVENKGRAHVVYIPGIAPENRDDYKVTLSVPKDFGPIHGFGELPKEVSSSSSGKTYSFGPQDLIDQSVQILFGDSATYQTNFNFPLENKSGFPKVYEVTLPPTTEAQTVYLNKIDPKPEGVRLDPDNI